ncbi:unnamed protein product [Tilletia controversa]|uniref:Uncharacterized protein n=2 Tax=Tilletia TaxID=13289 RepID=A0A8X7SWB3_9BASI|nr:hypothetical protein CF336_g7396 [Tilletia laevis]KAE8246985.1 hypothetical protein A4X06_0g4782 [Tilletia controversa]CAD6892759.1 unnamed protein product [Tilletia caries]CAD6911810.1 unnamed protein product [Tilletia controversa]CAD6937728.1 unnamed protein product [Tilletia controversa]
MYQLSGPASPGSLDFKISSSGGRRPSTLARSGAAAFDAATRRLQGLGGVVGHSVGRRGSRAAGEVSIGIRRKLCSDDAQLPLSSNIVRHEQMHAGGGATSVLLPSACSAMTDDSEDQALTNGSHSRRQNQDLEFIAGSARERGDYGEVCGVVVRVSWLAVRRS